LLTNLGLWDTFLNQHKDAKQAIIQHIKSFKNADGVFSEDRGTSAGEGDVTSTYFGIATATALNALKEVGLGSTAGEWIVSLQAPNGGFRLRKSSNSGHYVNTLYALQALELLNKTNLLESTYSRSGGVSALQGVQFIPTIAIWIVIVLVLVASCLLLWLMSPSLSDEKEKEEEEETAEGEDKEETKGKDKNEKGDKEKAKPKKRSKKEPTITLYRDKVTQQCVDTDGEPFAVDSLNKKEWDIISKEEKDTHTVFVIRKKDSKTDSRGSRGRKRNK